MLLNDCCGVYTRLYYNTDFLWMAVLLGDTSTGREPTQRDTAKQCITSQLTLLEQALTKLYQQILSKEKEGNSKSGKLFSKSWMDHGTLVCWKPPFRVGSYYGLAFKFSLRGEEEWQIHPLSESMTDTNWKPLPPKPCIAKLQDKK